MSDVTTKTTTEWQIETAGSSYPRIEVDSRDGYVRIYQDGETPNGDIIMIDPAAVPAVIAAIQAAASEVRDE